MKFVEGYRDACAAVEEAGLTRAFSVGHPAEADVARLCEEVRVEGDSAVLRSVEKFDCPGVGLTSLRVTPQEMEEGCAEAPARALEALERAAVHIRAFHEKQPVWGWDFTSPVGVTLGQRYTPLSRVGLYAPNGRAAYPSTVLMLAIPARVAGVGEIVLATPAGKDGRAHSIILAAARVAGITEIYKMGGAAAVAALAYGTSSVPRVDKIVGPGSLYLTLAKKHLFGVVGIDGLYGPSEVVVLAEAVEQPEQLAPQLAADLLAQAEHGADSFVCFISPSLELCHAVMSEVVGQAALSRRGAILLESLQKALICHVATRDEACRLCDKVAAEHVEIWARDAAGWAQAISNAGALFLNTPVPLGDYLAGPSHTLPTGMTARFASGVGVDTFLKRSSIVAAPRSAMAALAADLEVIAELEDLPGHAAAVRMAGREE
jgi:histidinol dehydrogenase